MPAYGRHHTSQLLKVGKYNFLIDCGEGTQLLLTKYNIKLQKIDHIFISHLHGDHYLGLIGLIKTQHLQGRSKSLFIFGPRGLQEIITIQLKHSRTALNYKIIFQETNDTSMEPIFQNESLTISSFPLQHRIPCTGFFFEEKPKPRKINKETMPEDLSQVNIVRLKNGKDIVDEAGALLYKNADLTLPPKKSRSYAYCSDTIYDEGIVPYIQGADLLYHEATFLEERDLWASKTFHSTAKQAAMIAKKANVGKLLLGHFSARYKDLTPFKEEAKQIFKNADLAIEGEEFNVKE